MIDTNTYVGFYMAILQLRDGAVAVMAPSWECEVMFSQRSHVLVR